MFNKKHRRKDRKENGRTIKCHKEVKGFALQGFLQGL
jgi:hypothetical protein